MTDDQALGTEDLEAGMRPSRASSFALIAVISVAMLAVFNSRALVEWTHQPQPGPVIAALEPPAVIWHGWMVRLGTATAFEKLRDRVRPLLQ
ncbi:MAG TPA: hypothetical protein VMI56_26375 [Reyranella sp.]|nr:hypothetical protein [Reyranella sp.]